MYARINHNATILRKLEKNQDQSTSRTAQLDKKIQDHTTKVQHLEEDIKNTHSLAESISRDFEVVKKDNGELTEKIKERKTTIDGKTEEIELLKEQIREETMTANMKKHDHGEEEGFHKVRKEEVRSHAQIMDDLKRRKGHLEMMLEREQKLRAEETKRLEDILGLKVADLKKLKITKNTTTTIGVNNDSYFASIDVQANEGSQDLAATQKAQAVTQ